MLSLGLSFFVLSVRLRVILVLGMLLLGVLLRSIARIDADAIDDDLAVEVPVRADARVASAEVLGDDNVGDHVGPRHARP